MEAQSSLRAVLLDFDGTLVNLPVDWPRLREDVRQLFHRHGITDEFSPLYAAVAHSLERLKSHGVSAQARGRIRREINSLMKEAEMVAAGDATPRPGASDFLARTAARGWMTIIQTSNSVRCVQDVLIRLAFPLPNAICGRESTRNPKPHPEGVRRVLRTFGISPREAVVIGDGDYDIELGRTIGARTIWVVNEKRPQLAGGRPELQVSSLAEAFELLVGERQLQGVGA